MHFRVCFSSENSKGSLSWKLQTRASLCVCVSGVMQLLLNHEWIEDKYASAAC